MRRKIVACHIVLLVLALGRIVSGADSGAKVVFLRGNEVVAANVDGTIIKPLTHDGLPKSSPAWSPNGQQVAYVLDRRGEKSLGTVVVTTADGIKQRELDVLTEAPDGTLIDGMRFIEESGWLSNTAVFVSGSVNPYIAEYRILDSNNGKSLGGYLGLNFATCPGRGQVSYVSKENNSTRPHIEVNGKTVYAPTGQVNLRELHWSSDCARLALFEDEGSTTNLIVLNQNQLEYKTQLTGEGWESGTIEPALDSFLVLSPPKAYLYDVASRSLGNPEIAKQIERDRESRARLIEKLNGRSPNWWEPSSH